MGIDKYNLSVDGCRVYKSLMSICHAENVFPNEHLNSSNLWISIHQSEFNGSEFYDPEQILQSSNGTSGQPISGIYGWSPVTQDTNTTEQLVSDTPRKKRSPLFLTQLVQVFTNIHALNKAIHTPTTPTPWVEYYNETHNIIQNYTFMHLVRSTEEKENVTSLGFSNDTQKASDLFTWHTEKYSRCEQYKRILDVCHRNNMTSQTSAKVTSPLEIVKKEESLSMDLDNLSVKKCDSHVSVSFR